MSEHFTDFQGSIYDAIKKAIVDKVPDAVVRVEGGEEDKEGEGFMVFHPKNYLTLEKEASIGQRDQTDAELPLKVI